MAKQRGAQPGNDNAAKDHRKEINSGIRWGLFNGMTGVGSIALDGALSNNSKAKDKAQRRTETVVGGAKGGITGGVIGGIVGGPPGAMVGAALGGALTGGSYNATHRASAKVGKKLNDHQVKSLTSAPGNGGKSG